MAETCSHHQTNKSRSYDSCVLTDPTNPHLHMPNLQNAGTARTWFSAANSLLILVKPDTYIPMKQASYG